MFNLNGILIRFVFFFSVTALSFFSCPLLWAQEPARPAVNETTAMAEDKDPVIATVGTRQIRASELEKRIDGLPPQLKTYYKGPGKRQFVNELIRMELLNGEAIRRKLDTLPDVKAQLDMARASILANAAIQALEKETPVTDAEIQTYYAGHVSEFEEIRVRHILVRSSSSILPPTPGAPTLTPEEARTKAQTLRKQILAGADFAQIAQKNSDDTTTAPRGGDLGFVKRGQNIPPFEQAAFALVPGQISDVIETPYGFHVIKVESKRTFDELKDQVATHLKQTKAKEKLAELTKQINPVVNERYFQTGHSHAGEPIPSYEMEVRPKAKSADKGAAPPNGAKP